MHRLFSYWRTTHPIINRCTAVPALNCSGSLVIGQRMDDDCSRAVSARIPACPRLRTTVVCRLFVCHQSPRRGRKLFENGLKKRVTRISALCAPVPPVSRGFPAPADHKSQGLLPDAVAYARETPVLLLLRRSTPEARDPSHVILRNGMELLRMESDHAGGSGDFISCLHPGSRARAHGGGSHGACQGRRTGEACRMSGRGHRRYTGSNFPLQHPRCWI